MRLKALRPFLCHTTPEMIVQSAWTLSLEALLDGKRYNHGGNGESNAKPTQGKNDTLSDQRLFFSESMLVKAIALASQ